jgi:hypothetical protein
MAVVHVTAPADVDPHVIEAELTRAITSSRKQPMSAELALAEDVRSAPRHGRRRHGFVAILRVRGEEVPADFGRRLRKVARKGLRRSFGRSVSAKVRLEMSPAEVAAYWCSVRGRPHRQV